MRVLVDSSVWIDYFRGKKSADILDILIEEGLILTNQLILAELLPHMLIRKEKKLSELLKSVPQLPLEIDWDAIVQLQVTCLKKGINKVGLPDLIIAQNAMQNDAVLYSLDQHFQLISKHILLTVQK